MSIFRKDSGNWADDLGRSMIELVVIGFISLFLVPILIVTIVVLLATR